MRIPGIGNMLTYSLLIILLVSGTASATKHYVSPSGNDNTGNGSLAAPYRTIQKGIDVAAAGDSVMALAGTYAGSINLKDGVSVIGSGSETATIDGNGATVIVTAATALIQGFTIRDGETAILYDGNSSVSVHSNHITDCYYGIDGYVPFEEGPITPDIRDNVFETILWGINLDEQAFANGGVNGTIENNTFVATAGAQFNTGIRYRMHQSQPVITANVIVGNKNGIEFTYMTIFEQRKQLVSCNNVWGNTYNYWNDNSTQLTGFQGNISEDPEFCDAANGDFEIFNTSPNAPANNSCAVLIGAKGVGCETLCGDADHSGTITISDAVNLVNYIFAGGPAPFPSSAGDSDCNGFITISDAVYLINYIFVSGPAPCASC